MMPQVRYFMAPPKPAAAPQAGKGPAQGKSDELADFSISELQNLGK
jgi:hypothetical protein